MNRFLLIILFAVCSPLTAVVAQDITKIDSILCDVIHAKDQDLRLRLYEEGLSAEDTMEIWRNINESDRQNQEYVADILDTYGWPEGLSSEADQTIFLVIQHADLEYIEKYYPMLEEQAAEKPFLRSSCATMLDRILMYERKPQIYGTQHFVYIIPKPERILIIYGP